MEEGSFPLSYLLSLTRIDRVERGVYTGFSRWEPGVSRRASALLRRASYSTRRSCGPPSGICEKARNRLTE